MDVLCSIQCTWAVLHLDIPLDGYYHVEHPLQQLPLETLSDLADHHLTQYPIVIDGCGLPAPTLQLWQLGHAMAHFANPVDLSDSRAQAIYRLQKAITNDPLYLPGHGTEVSELNAVTNGHVLEKSGAEGIINCGHTWSKSGHCVEDSWRQCPRTFSCIICNSWSFRRSI